MNENGHSRDSVSRIHGDRPSPAGDDDNRGFEMLGVVLLMTLCVIVGIGIGFFIRSAFG